MRSLSLWGKKNKWWARFIIILSNIILALLGLNLGFTLEQNGIELPLSIFIGLCTGYFLAILIYPYRSDKRSSHVFPSFYVRRKSTDLLLAVCGFGMFLFVGNHPGQLINFKGSLYASVPAGSILPKDVKPYKSIAEFNRSLKGENGKLLKWKERRKLLKEQLKGIKSSSELSPTAKTLLTILSVIVAIGLLYVVAALSCNLSCNGSDAAAVLVGVGGTALVIFLTIVVIRAIYGNRKKKKKQATESQGT